MKGLIAKLAIAGLGTLIAGGFTFAAVGNDHTGFDSDNNASIEGTNTAAIDVINDTLLTNTVDGTALSGTNDSSYNTGNGEVKGGDASFDISVTSKANDSKLSMIADTMPLGIQSVTNSTTGASSTNDAWISFDNSLDVTTTNTVDVANVSTLMADTGLNTSSYNTGNGHVTSGNAAVSVSYNNTLNTSDVSIH